MIQLDQMVCSVYLAVQLKEFGIPQLSQFYYKQLNNTVVYGRADRNILCSAYTSDELLNLFQYPIEKDGYTYHLSIEHYRDDYEILLRGNQIDAEEIFYKKRNKKLADALAELLVHLYELEFFE